MGRVKAKTKAQIKTSTEDRTKLFQRATQMPAQSVEPNGDAENRPERTLLAETLAVAEQLHSAAIHLLRRLRIRDLASGVGPAQLSALSVLVFGGPRSLSELAIAEQVRAPTMSRIVASLERSGLVRRYATEDGRRVRLDATSKGEKIMEEGRRRRVEVLAEAVTRLPRSEGQQLAELIRLLQQILRFL